MLFKSGQSLWIRSESRLFLLLLNLLNSFKCSLFHTFGKLLLSEIKNFFTEKYKCLNWHKRTDATRMRKFISLSMQYLDLFAYLFVFFYISNIFFIISTIAARLDIFLTIWIKRFIVKVHEVPRSRYLLQTPKIFKII